MPNWKKVAVSGSNVHFNQVSSSGDFNLKDGIISYQTNTSIDTGTETVATLDSSYKAGFFDYLATSGSNLRAGTITIISDGSGNTQMAENSTQDIGDTETCKFSSSFASSAVTLSAVVGSDSWSIKTIVRGM